MNEQGRVEASVVGGGGGDDGGGGDGDGGRSGARAVPRGGARALLVAAGAALAVAAGCTTMPLPEDPFARSEVAALRAHFEADGRRHQLPFTVAIARPEPPPDLGGGAATTTAAAAPAPARAPGDEPLAAEGAGARPDRPAFRSAPGADPAASATTTAARAGKLDVEAAGAEDHRTGAQAFDAAALQERFALDLANLGLFREVVALGPIEAAATPEEGRDLLLFAAREVRADLLLIPRFGRYDASYVGMTGWWPLSWFLGFAFWWPSLFFPDEEWAATVVLDWELQNVRSEKTIWSSSFPARATGQMDDFDRGMDFPGPWGIPLFTNTFLGVEERNLAAAGEHLLPVALARAQADFLAELGRRYKELPDIKLDAAKAQTVALVIGIDRLARRAPHVPELTCAKQDALSVAEYLRDPNGGAIADARSVTLLTDERATFAAVSEFFDVTVRRLASGDSVVVYFAGYGATDARGDGYLVLHDTDPISLARALPVEKLASLFNRRNVTVVIDASWSGTGGRTLPPPPGRRARVHEGKALEAGARQQRQNFLLAACDPRGVAQEYEPERHGVFTLLFLQALREAEVDDKGQVTLAAVMAWLEERLPPVSGVLGQAQQPVLWAAERGDAGARVLAVRPEG